MYIYVYTLIYVYAEAQQLHVVDGVEPLHISATQSQGDDLKLLGCASLPKNVCKDSLDDGEFLLHDALTSALNHKVDMLTAEVAKKGDTLFEFSTVEMTDESGAPLQVYQLPYNKQIARENNYSRD